ncbi:MAG: type II toxin-antitoxin system RelE/ParE family toxin [Phaeodactylibacter sp.]|nr:type II toxin-antitoxin system RelE/ParE family toxin [Phaeodactylibacter sp.]
MAQEEFRIIVTPEAKDGLQSIVEYLENKVSVNTADKVRKRLLEAMDSLSEMPQRHGIVGAISDEEVTYRRINEGRYRIIFVIEEDKKEVKVIDISYVRRGPDHLEQVKKR